jgi:hypothetical protein
MKKTLWKRIADQLPVSRATHEAELKKERERISRVISERQKEIEAEREIAMKKLDDLIGKVARITFEPDPYTPYGREYGLQLRVSEQMMRFTHDPHHHKMIAESLGHQVTAEILRSRFVM